jgi:3-oxoadipate enol-lactonase
MQATINSRSIDFSSNGKDVPLLLMHGFPLNRSMFDAQVAEFSKVARFVTFDVPGLGESEPGAVTMDGIADVAAGLMDELGIEAAVVGGVSKGGYASFEFARRYPKRLRGLILADTRPAADTPEGVAARNVAIELVTKYGVEEWGQLALPKFVGPTTKKARPEVVDSVCRMIESASPKVVTVLWKALASRPDNQDLLAGIKVPTLVVSGAEDEITPADEAREWADRIPRSEFVEIATAGHLDNIERPAVFNEAVSGFLERLTP